MTRAAPARLFLRGAKQLLYPRRCPFCGTVLGYVPECEECAPKLEALMLHKERRLRPETHYFGALDGAAALFRYEGCVRDAILRMKYADAADSAPELGNWIAKELFQCTFSRKYGILVPERALFAFGSYDAVVPVPASNKMRGYNVPLLMAEPLARALEAPLLPTALRRIHFRKHQAGLRRHERLVNVAGAFKGQPEPLEGRRVLLVDDVITTGATAAACTQALLAAGAQSVFAVAFAAAPERKAAGTPDDFFPEEPEEGTE